MTSYNLHPSQYTNGTDLQRACGQQYHLGLSDGSVYYGYLLEPSAGKDGGFKQRSDTASKDALINYSSGQLIDRDLAYFPRVTDGDFSGGGYQEVWIDPKAYFDSDLDSRVAGFLQLAPNWARVSKASLGITGAIQVVAWKGDFWYTFGESNGNLYSANGGTTTTPVAAALTGLDTDGTYLFAMAGSFPAGSSGFYVTGDGTTWSTISTQAVFTVLNAWVIRQGTNGYFLYYWTGPSFGLYKIDLSAGLPIGVGSHVVVPIGVNTINVIDIVPYQTGIAILTSDPGGVGYDIWFHDGSNMTRIIRVEGYIAQGMCQALGSLYISAYAVGKAHSPVLAKIDAGAYSIVTKPGSPFLAANQSCLQPRSSGQYVYWPLLNQSINGISGSKGLVLRYDTVTGTLTHLPNFDANDFTAIGGTLRTVAFAGEDCAIAYLNGQTGILQYQQTSNPGTTVALVGTIGAVSVGAAGAAVTPAWGASENRTAGNLLLCWATASSLGAPGPGIGTTPAGWTLAKQVQDGLGHTQSTLLYRIATGADAAPTIGPGDGVTVISTRLAEFSGNAASPLDQSQSASGTPPASPLTLVNPAADASPGDLVIYGTSLAYTVSGTKTFSDQLNNGMTTTSVTSAAVNTSNHYSFGYGIMAANLDNIPPDIYSLTFTTTNAAGGAAVLASFKRNLPAVSFTYAPSGWLVSSHIDFATPGIGKRFRRIEVHHAPLAAGESILIKAFVDRDPLAFTTGLTPVPSTATATNSTLGAVSTIMTFGQDTIGKTIYFALKLTAGTSNATTPRVSYVSIEVGGTWTWDLALACTSKRRLLDGQNEETMPPGKDLAYLLLLAYENGTNLTLYHRNGSSYTVTIESLELWHPSPQLASQPQLVRDEEYVAKCVLRQVA